jgi:hypothetical protein
MDMQMHDFLTATPARIDDGPKTIIQTLLLGQHGRQQQDTPQQLFMPWVGIRQRNDMFLGHDHEMHRGHRVDVMKDNQVIILIHLAAGDIPRGDLAEDAITTHGHSLREAIGLLHDILQYKILAFA